jgi:hypothetical protein
MEVQVESFTNPVTGEEQTQKYSYQRGFMIDWTK